MSTDGARQRLRQGGLRGEELLAWLVKIPPAERDRAVERLLGVDEYSLDPSRPGEELIGYVPSGISAIVQTVFDTPITREDVFVDLGAGLGKAAMAVHLLTGARARGIELDPSLAARSAASADALGLADVQFVAADARTAALDEGTVFFLYLPFTGAALADVLRRLRAVAAHRRIVVCALGMELRATGEWLTPRETDSFWLSIYDSAAEGASRASPPSRSPMPLTPHAAAIAHER